MEDMAHTYPHTRSKPINPITHRRHPYTPTNIRPHTKNTTSQSNQRAFSARTSPGRQCNIPRIQSSAKNIIVAVAGHY